MRDRRHWSYSSISQYLRCPLQFFFQRVLNLPSHTVSSNLVLGSSVHAGLAEYHRRLKESEDVDRTAIMQAYHECWNEKEAKESIQFREGDTRDDSMALGVHLLELYLKEPPVAGIIAIEHRILVPLYNSKGEYLETPLLAIADLITASDDILTVREFKTSGRAYSASDVEFSLQPTCYVHAVRETYGRDANVEYTVLVKTKTPKVQRIQTSRYQQDVARLGDLVETVERAVDFGIFYAVESAMNCSTCSFRAQCRDWGNCSQPQEQLIELASPQEALACSQN